MLVALLAVLGVNLIIVILLAVVLSRKAWVSHQPGAFRGAIRVVEGEVRGLRPRWRRRYFRWVRDILIWTKGPFLFRTEMLMANALAGDARVAHPGEVRRVGKNPAIVLLAVEGGPDRDRHSKRSKCPGGWAIRPILASPRNAARLRVMSRAVSSSLGLTHDASAQQWKYR